MVRWREHGRREFRGKELRGREGEAVQREGEAVQREGEAVQREGEAVQREGINKEYNINKFISQLNANK